MELTKREIEHWRDALDTEQRDGLVLPPGSNILCDMALAALSAKERGVHGWAVVRKSGGIVSVGTLPRLASQQFGYDNPDEIPTDYNLKPVTITINAAGQEEARSLSKDTVPPKLERAKEPVPSAPAAPSTRYLWRYRINGVHTGYSDTEPPDDAYDEGTLERFVRMPVAESAEPSPEAALADCIERSGEADGSTLVIGNSIFDGYTVNDLIAALRQRAQEKP